jgi:predicted ATPase
MTDRYPLQGRESEMFRLGAAWGGAVRGRPGLILLSGAAGMGRTRLAAETADLAGRTGGTVRWLRGRETPDPGVLATLAGNAPVLLVVDDAGPEAVDALRPGAGTRLLVVATVRPDEPAPESATRIDVRPLPPAAVSRLAEAAGQPGAADRIQERTGGMPLFAVEALRDLAAGAPDVPESFDALVGDRLRRLGEPAGRVLRTAAGLGPEADPAILAGHVDLPVPAVARLCAAGVEARLLVPTGGGYEFAHELIRAAVSADRPP